MWEKETGKADEPGKGIQKSHAGLMVKMEKWGNSYKIVNKQSNSY